MQNTMKFIHCYTLKRKNLNTTLNKHSAKHYFLSQESKYNDYYTNLRGEVILYAE